VHSVSLAQHALQLAKESGSGRFLLEAWRMLAVALNANEQYEAWREGDHDDLVLAVAMACWLGQQCQPGRIVAGGQQYVSSAPGVQAEKRYNPYGSLGGHG